MHLYFYARGKFEQVEQWKAHAQASYWKFRRINNKVCMCGQTLEKHDDKKCYIQKGKEKLFMGKFAPRQETILVQGALRPSVLGAFEFVFPKEALAEVLSFFGIEANTQYGFKGISLESRHFVLRKVFGAKKIPKDILDKAKKIQSTFSTEEFERGCSNCVIPGVALHVIGIKDDEMGVIGNYTQELL
jgi:hypothetical protein